MEKIIIYTTTTLVTIILLLGLWNSMVERQLLYIIGYAILMIGYLVLGLLKLIYYYLYSSDRPNIKFLYSLYKMRLSNQNMLRKIDIERKLRKRCPLFTDTTFSYGSSDRTNDEMIKIFTSELRNKNFKEYV